MWFEILAGTLIAAVNVSIHSLGSYIVPRWLLGTWLKTEQAWTMTRAYRAILRVSAMLLTLHFIEAAVWAEFYYLQHLLPDRETAYYFSLTSYTTVGYGDVVLPKPWRLMGPLEAMAGVLMFGWSTAILVALLYVFVESRKRNVP